MVFNTAVFVFKSARWIQDGNQRGLGEGALATASQNILGLEGALKTPKNPSLPRQPSTA